ncbi:CBS domain-containing protein [Nocardiopsis aegyptia]|uniref:CBS domain-containing protein n=1 Tax=Nocardiopsis aegyptia TaxID=220378 RepID=A0A7Z0JCX5_9ACTN|nr:CBS domain-containing protein [Nocardiopsis aegyptia]NYJ36889.1 CBS domain-containing protein [Nocardiopsis aegyptia]
MARTVADVMTSPVRTMAPEATLREVAQVMRESDVGDVILAEGDHPVGIVTDRDIVVRCLATGGDPETQSARSICSSVMVSVPPQSGVSDAVRKMRDDAVRRLPVVENDHLVGIVTMGDLAVETDRESALADVSAADPNR